MIPAATSACVNLNEKWLSLLSISVATFEIPVPISSEILKLFEIGTDPVVQKLLHVTFVFQGLEVFPFAICKWNFVHSTRAHQFVLNDEVYLDIVRQLFGINFYF